MPGLLAVLSLSPTRPARWWRQIRPFTGDQYHNLLIDLTQPVDGGVLTGHFLLQNGTPLAVASLSLMMEHT
jgi:hypothetical protein